MGERILEGQVALATGASSGIGKAVARELGNAGAKVVVNYHLSRLRVRRVAAERADCFLHLA